MLLTRLLLAVLIVAPLLAMVVADYGYALTSAAPGAVLFPLGGLVVSLACVEVHQLLKAGGHRPPFWMVQFGAWLVWLSCGVVVYWPLFGGTYPPDCPIGRLGWPLGAFAVAVPAVFLSQMRDFRPGSQAIVRVALAVFVIGYVAMTSSFLVWLRLFQGNRWGMTALISLILITKLSDTGAYAAGRLLGRNRMAPVLSPKKTWEGAAGGVVAAILASWLYFAVAPRWIVGPDAVAGSVWGAAVYGVVLAFAGIVGDLSESLLKRDVEQKDSGTLPGLGGVLDIIDSLLFAAAPAYLCWAVGLVGPGGS